MAKVLLACTHQEDPKDFSFQRGAYHRLRESYDLGDKRHQLVDDPADADMILFAQLHINFASQIRSHPFYRSFRQKVFAFGIDDQPLPLVPGVYASLEKKWYLPGRSRAGFYLSAVENLLVEFDPTPIQRDLLYSFVGSVTTSPVRAALAQLEDPRGFFVDTSKESLPLLLRGSEEQRQIFWRKYADIGRRSQFVLCPRGAGTSSIRLFETMQMGRVPVIVSDEWVAPEGPLWAEFSIRVAEHDIQNIPSLLQAQEAGAEAMGLRAREEWERWFAPAVRFNTVVDWCLDIKATRGPRGERAQSTRVWLQLLRPTNFRRYFRSKRVQLKERLRGAKA